MRQAVRSRLIVGATILILTTLFLITIFFLMNKEIAQQSLDNSNGKYLFTTISTLFGFIAIFLLPFYLNSNFSRELANADNELFFNTALKPAQIIFGKLFTGLTILLLLLSLFMPFMMLSYLLRGLSLPTIFNTIFFISLTSITFQSICLRISKQRLKIIKKKKQHQRGGITAVFFMLPVIFMFFMFIGASRVWRHAFPSIFGSPLRSNTGILVFFIFIILATYFIIAAIATITSERQNRVLPIRIYMTSIIFLVFLPLAIYREIISSDPILQIWYIGTTIMCALFIIGSIDEPHTITTRIRYEIPSGIKLRLLAYPFYSGAQRGVFLSTLIFLISSTIFYVSDIHLSKKEILLTKATIFLFGILFIYLLLGLLIEKIISLFIKRKKDGSNASIFLKVVVFQTILFIIFTNKNENWQKALNYLENNSNYCFTILGIICLVLIAINYSWFLRGITEFIPLPNKQQLKEEHQKLKELKING